MRAIVNVFVALSFLAAGYFLPDEWRGVLFIAFFVWLVFVSSQLLKKGRPKRHDFERGPNWGRNLDLVDALRAEKQNPGATKRAMPGCDGFFPPGDERRIPEHLRAERKPGWAREHEGQSPRHDGSKRSSLGGRGESSGWYNSTGCTPNLGPPKTETERINREWGTRPRQDNMAAIRGDEPLSEGD